MLVYTETEQGKFKASAFELISYAKASSNNVIAVAFNIENTDELYRYGASKVVLINDDRLRQFNAKAYACVLKQVSEKEGDSQVLLSSSVCCKTLSPFLSIELNAAILPMVTSLQEGGKFSKVLFSSKAMGKIHTEEANKIIILSNNSFGARESAVEGVKETFTPSLDESLFKGVKVLESIKSTGKVSISDAKIIVSGGRGLKGSENWAILEELADSLNAALGCTKPVSDMGWRPHEEHIGQTGKTVSCNIYIAVGISGAIQHLAGVNSCKKKIVINTDCEAPFFKAADYGIVGDAFEVVPKLTALLKERIK